jgi:hypothetical protein
MAEQELTLELDFFLLIFLYLKMYNNCLYIGDAMANFFLQFNPVNNLIFYRVISLSLRRIV